MKKLLLTIFISVLGMASLWAQQVTGVVLDQNTQEPLPGVNVMIKGTFTGAITDLSGQYTVQASGPETVLVFSFVGYLSTEETVGNRTTINVSLAEDVVGLEEVVVVGYGTQKKASLTAAIEQVTTEQLETSPVSNASSALVGRAPGLITVQTSGEIGEDQTQILIRGRSTTGNASPLIVVDGIPRGSLNEIDVNNVETYTVLKDAAAVAPYGMAGANGVILVTTKTGKQGKAKINYNGWYGWQNPTIDVDYMNAYEFASTYDKAEDLAGVAPEDRKYSADDLENYKRSVNGDPNVDKNLYPNADPKSYLFNGNAPLSNHHLSMSGGNEAVSYYTGLNYMYQEEQWSTSNLDRIGLVTNIDIKASDKTKIGFSINAWNQNSLKTQYNSNTIYASYQSWLPVEPISFIDDGNELLGASSKNGQVIPDLVNKGAHNDDQTKIMSSLTIEQTLAKGLTLKGVVAYDWTILDAKNWNEPGSNYFTLDQSVTPYTFVEVVNQGQPSLSEHFHQWRDLTYQGILNYNGQSGDHRYGFLAVAETRNGNYKNHYASRSHYEIPIDEISLGSSNKEYQDNGGGSSEYAQAGFVGKINYAFKDKYLLEATGRYDGHYYFAPNKKWGFFPAVALGWRISEEDFMSSMEMISSLKIRGSVGQSGALAGGPNQYSSSLTLYGNSYPFGGVPTQGIYVTREGNPEITWEKATKYNIGVDYALWNGLLSGKLDYFFEERDNMLVSPNASVPQEYGIGLAQVNAGRMQNQGIEMELRSFKSFSKDFQVNGGVVFTFVRNKVLEIFENEATRDHPNRSRTGQPLNSIWGYEAIGLFQLSDDKNGDGVINADDGFPVQRLGGTPTPGSIQYANLYDAPGETSPVINLEDETRIGYPTVPEIIYGFDLGAAWKGVSLSLLFQGAAHTNALISGPYINVFKEQHNLIKENEDSWTPENTDALYPIVRPNGQLDNDMTASSWFLMNMSYLRLKNFELGYTLPSRITQTVNIERVKIYLAGTNMLTFSHTRNLLDPEQDQSSTSGAQAERGWYHPQNKVFSVGLNLTF